MPSTRTIGLRCTTLEIAVMRLRRGASMESDCGLSMESFAADGLQRPKGAARLLARLPAAGNRRALGRMTSNRGILASGDGKKDESDGADQEVRPDAHA